MNVRLNHFIKNKIIFITIYYNSKYKMLTNYPLKYCGKSYKKFKYKNIKIFKIKI